MKYKAVKPEKMGGMEIGSPSSEGYRPSISIPLSALPEAKDWDVSEQYEVALQLKMTGIHMSKGRNGKEEGGASFEITGIAIIEGEKIMRYGSKKKEDDTNDE